MIEPVGACVKCGKEVTCNDGFLNGEVQEDKTVLCFSCKAKEELVALLNSLLEAEKAGVATLDYLMKTYPSTDLDALFKQIKDDEAWSCQGLIKSVKREGGSPSTGTGAFVDKVKALDTLEQKIALLIKGQAWVARKIDDALKMEIEQETRTFLEEMKRKHVENIAAIE